MASKKRRKHHARVAETTAAGGTPAVVAEPALPKDARDAKPSGGQPSKAPWSRRSLALLIGAAWLLQICIDIAFYVNNHAIFGSVAAAIAEPPSPVVFLPACLIFETPVRMFLHERKLGILESLSVGAVTTFIALGMVTVLTGINSPSTSGGPTASASPSVSAAARSSPSATPAPTPTLVPSPSGSPAAVPTPVPGSNNGFTQVAPDQISAVALADVVAYILSVLLYAPIYRFLFNPQARADAQRRRQERDRAARQKAKEARRK